MMCTLYSVWFGLEGRCGLLWIETGAFQLWRCTWQAEAGEPLPEVQAILVYTVTRVIEQDSD